MHDITIFRGGEKEVEKSNRDRKAVYFKLKDGERMIGDSGYNGEPNKLTVWKDEHAKGLKKFIGRVCARQETFFKGLKDWKILRDRFAYGKTTKERMELHKMVVEAIAVEEGSNC